MANQRARNEGIQVLEEFVCRAEAAPRIAGDEALRIAHRDAETAYREFGGFRIILALNLTAGTSTMN